MDQLERAHHELNDFIRNQAYVQHFSSIGLLNYCLGNLRKLCTQFGANTTTKIELLPLEKPLEATDEISFIGFSLIFGPRQTKPCDVCEFSVHWPPSNEFKPK